MMKLLIVAQAADRDDPNLGAFYYWFEMLARRADSVVILAGRAGATDFPPHMSVFTFEKKKGIFGRVRRLWKFWELFSRHFADANAVLFHQIPEYVLAASPFLLGRGRKVAALWYAHGAVSWRLRLAERMVDYIFTSSAGGFRLPSKKAIYMGQAINTELFQPSVMSPQPSVNTVNNGLRLLTIGRIAPVKNYETIIAACAILRDTWPHGWALTIVGGPITAGDRAYAEKLRNLVREKGLVSHIHFAGELAYSEIPGLLAEYDLFLNASRTGSLDKAVLEAMACGLTVLTSNAAYRAILPPQYFVEDPLPERFAERIASLAREARPNMGLRGIVARDHALCATMDRMAAYLGSRV